MRWTALFLYLVLASPVSAQTFETDRSQYPAGSLIEDIDAGLGAADTSPARALSPVALAMVKDFEKWKANPYNDAVGYCTIGYGHLIAKQSCESLGKVALGEFASEITRSRGLDLLDADTNSARRAVSKSVKIRVSDAQYGALVSFTFNVGKGAFEKSTLLRLVNAEQHKSAAKQFLRWIIANGIVLDGLIARRSCEQALYQDLLKLNPDGRFDRERCASLGAAPPAGELIDVLVGER